MQAHGVAPCLMEYQGEALEAHHVIELASQLMKQRSQIAVREDRLRDSQQSLISFAGARGLPVGVSDGHGETLVIHSLGTDKLSTGFIGCWRCLRKDKFISFQVGRVVRDTSLRRRGRARSAVL